MTGKNKWVDHTVSPSSGCETAWLDNVEYENCGMDGWRPTGNKRAPLHYDKDPEDYMWEFPPTAHPGREAATAIIALVLAGCVSGAIMWKLVWWVISWL